MTHKCCIQNKHLLPQSGRQFVALANAADVANISLHLLTLVRLTSSPMLIIVMLTRAVQYAGFILKNSAIFTVFFSNWQDFKITEETQRARDTNRVTLLADKPC